MSTLPQAFLTVPLAHRGLHDPAAGRPENSRAAIRAAMDAGYGIEIDLQLSRDGRAMVFHDDVLDRVTPATGPLAQRLAAELQAIPLSGGQEGIPRLADVLDLVDGKVPLLIELKDQHGAMGPTDGALERAVALDLQGYAGPVALMSFNPHMVITLAGLAPEWPRGLVTCAYRAADWPLLPQARRAALRAISDYARAGAVFVSHAADDLASPHVARRRAQGAKLLTWTIRSPREEAVARRVADNITFEGYLAPLPA